MKDQHLKKSHTLKKVANILAIAGITSSSLFSMPLTIAATTSASNFTDITGNYTWAQLAINTLAQDGIINGRSSTQFSPADSVTRAEFATMIVRALKLPLTKPTSPTFEDVNQQNGYYTYIETAYQYGIVKGTGTASNPTFSPNDPIKREDIVTMIINAIIKTTPTTYDLSGLQSFKDNSSVDTYAKIQVALATKLGILKGYEDQTFRPNATATRAEAAQIIYNQRQIANDKIKQVLTPTLTISSPSDTIAIGSSQTFSASATYSDGTKAFYPVAWSVSGNIGTIDTNGKFTASKDGSATITASMHIMDGYDVTATKTIQVTTVAPKLNLSSNAYTAIVGESEQLSYTAFDDLGNQVNTLPISWSVSGNLGTVDSQGVFTAAQSGSGTITAVATYPNGDTATATAQIQVTPKVTSLSIQPSLLKVPRTTIQKMVCQGTNSDGTQAVLSTANWSVSGGIGTIDSDGTFHATTEGSGTITATYQQSNSSSPLTVSIPITVVRPMILSPSIPSTSFVANQSIPVSVQVIDDTNQLASTDTGRRVIFTTTKPDGTTDTNTVKDQNGIATFNFQYVQAGTYTVVATGEGSTPAQAFTYQVVPGDPATLDVYSTPSPWVMPGHQITIKAVAHDAWGNTITGSDVPVQYTLDNNTLGSFATTAGTTGDDSSVGTFTAGPSKGDINLSATATIQGKTLTGKTTFHVYTDHAGGLVSGKGVWMAPQLGDTNNISATLQKFQAAGIKHIYLEVSDSSRGFYAKSDLENMLHLAHSMGFSVIGWTYSSLNDPTYDGQLAAQVGNYVTKSGDRLDAIAPDLEESSNMSDSNVATFAQTFRSLITSGNNYPFIAVTYPYSWKPSYPWKTIGQYFDVVVPMDYWHYRWKSYSYNDVYNTIKADITDIRNATGNPYMAVSIAGQAYNMFDDPSQFPTATEVQAALQAAKDSGCEGYSAYRGPFADTDAEWNALASFNW